LYLPTSLAAIYKGWFGLQDVNMNGRESEAMLDAGWDELGSRAGTKWSARYSPGLKRDRY
jgi:hypothetical protein